MQARSNNSIGTAGTYCPRLRPPRLVSSTFCSGTALSGTSAVMTAGTPSLRRSGSNSSVVTPLSSHQVGGGTYLTERRTDRRKKERDRIPPEYTRHAARRHRPCCL